MAKKKGSGDRGRRGKAKPAGGLPITRKSRREFKILCQSFLRDEAWEFFEEQLLGIAMEAIDADPDDGDSNQTLTDFCRALLKEVDFNTVVIDRLKKALKTN